MIELIIRLLFLPTVSCSLKLTSRSLLCSSAMPVQDEEGYLDFDAVDTSSESIPSSPDHLHRGNLSPMTVTIPVM